MPALGRPTALALPVHAPAQLPAQLPARTPAHVARCVCTHVRTFSPQVRRRSRRQPPAAKSTRWALVGCCSDWPGKGRRPGGAISVPIGAAWAAWPGRANSVTEGSSAPSGTAANVGSDGPAVPGKSRAGGVVKVRERARLRAPRPVRNTHTPTRLGDATHARPASRARRTPAPAFPPIAEPRQAPSQQSRHPARRRRARPKRRPPGAGL